MIAKPNGTPNGSTSTARSATAAMVVVPVLHAKNERDSALRLEEAMGLAEAIDLDVRHADRVRVNRPKPATLFGGGAVETLASLAETHGVEVVFVDSDLSPVQQRNLERALNAKVIDRTGLILEIFGERAQTKEGQLQVELAQLTYQRSRLVRSWTHLERQRGGVGFMGGPGESQLEIDRRIITDRIARLRKELEHVRQTRSEHRKARRKVPYPVVALVGYTNAGKSTLFNRLTKAEVMAEDMLFATLDPTLRRLELPSGTIVILSDTVGFIAELPPDLIAAFRATLEEVVEADVILHVRDISDPESDLHREDVLGVLKDLGLESVLEERLIEVRNKIDRLDAESAEILRQQTARNDKAVACSAVTGEGMDELLAAIDDLIGQWRRTVHLDVALTDGATIAWLYRNGEVLSRWDDDQSAHVTVRMEPADLARWEQRQSG